MTLDGFVIVQPLSPWDEEHRDQIIPERAFASFGRTEFEAWSRFLGPDKAWSDARPVLIQRWHDKGYRVHEAKMEIFA
jgi:hypothetical protein